MIAKDHHSENDLLKIHNMAHEVSKLITEENFKDDKARICGFLELPMKDVVSIYKTNESEESIDATEIDLPTLLKYLATYQILNEDESEYSDESIEGVTETIGMNSSTTNDKNTTDKQIDCMHNLDNVIPGNLVSINNLELGSDSYDNDAEWKRIEGPRIE